MKRCLRIFPCLIALLVLLGSAFAETGASDGGEGETPAPSYAERLEEARLKYNEKTIHFYRSKIGRKQKGKLNVCLYLSDDKTFYIVKIHDSTQITDEAEMEAILETVTRDKNFRRDLFGSISNMKAQWIAHNLAYSMATGNEEARKLIEIMTGTDIADVIGRSKELDIVPPAAMTPAESILYDVIEMVYRLNKN